MAFPFYHTIRNSLRLKAWLAIQAVTWIIIAAFLLANLWIEYASTRNIVQNQGKLLAQELINTTFHRMENLGGDLVDHSLRPGDFPEGTISLRITDAQKKIRYSNLADEIGMPANIPLDVQSEERTNPTDADRWRTRIDSRNLVLLSPLLNEKRCQHCHDQDPLLLGYAEVSFSTHHIFETFQRAQWLNLWMGVLLFLTLSVLSLFIIRRLLISRIQNVTEAMQVITQGNLKVRVDDSASDEIGLLARQFNRMVEEVSTTREREQELHRQEISQFDRLATIGELASGLAHEIRNPVAGIRAAIQILSRRVPDTDPIYPVYREIQNSTGRLDTLVRSLLSFARMEKPHFHPLNMNDIVEETLVIFQSNVGKECRIVKKLASDIPAVKGDAKLLQQVLLNLLINAQQAKDKELELIITSYCQPRHARFHGIPEGVDESWLRCHEGIIQVRISDNGPGIPQNQLQDIFRPFFTTKKSGTGLGLSISTRIIREHHGCLFAQNNPDQGATFVICLPIDGASENHPPIGLFGGIGLPQ